MLSFGFSKFRDMSDSSLNFILQNFKIKSLFMTSSSHFFLTTHSLIRGVLMQSCSAGAKKFTNLSMSIIIKIINFLESKIEFSKFCSYGTTIFNILDNTTKLWMTKYIIGEFFSSGGATLYKNPSDQTVAPCIL